MPPGDEALIQRLRDTQAVAQLVGDDPSFRAAIAVLPIAARSDATVLVSGETGTGKELVARALHYLSARAPHPFVAVNCGSLTDTLLEDELFGHERGAFTDAQQRRAGLIAQAERGTLFLDEIDSLTARGQVALLRVLQDRVFRPLGSQREVTAEVRFVAATNASLTTLVESGLFRADLYYRLCVFTIDLPPLRERPGDILPLAEHFLARHAPAGAGRLTLSPAAAAVLAAFPWPGNARELENVMLRATRLCEGTVIGVADLKLPIRTPVEPAADATDLSHGYQALKRRAVSAFEREYLTRLMHETGGNVTRAARLAGKERRDLGRLLKKHGLQPKAR
jgi:DNA-binding NtrC family response regulator